LTALGSLCRHVWQALNVYVAAGYIFSAAGSAAIETEQLLPLSGRLALGEAQADAEDVSMEALKATTETAEAELTAAAAAASKASADGVETGVALMCGSHRQQPC
jgi:hypothetical protein